MRNLKNDELKQVFGAHGGHHDDYTKPLKASFDMRGMGRKEGKHSKEGKHKCRTGNQGGAW